MIHFYIAWVGRYERLGRAGQGRAGLGRAGLGILNGWMDGWEVSKVLNNCPFPLLLLLLYPTPTFPHNHAPH